MKKTTVTGMHIGKDGSNLPYEGRVFYGNPLTCQDIPMRQILEAEGFPFYSESELPLEKADIILCVDPTPNDWKRIMKQSPESRKILLACDSPIYARFSHSVRDVFMNSDWDAVVTWNRSYDADFLFHYDIPAGCRKTGETRLFPKEMDKLFLAQTGIAISDFRNGDYRGLVLLREGFYLELARKGLIDLYGKKLRLIPKKHIFQEPDDRLQLLRRYSFALIIENYLAPGYVSDMLPECILAGIPAIYLGDVSTAERRFPGTFVPLEEITLKAFQQAEEQLTARYVELQTNIQKCREQSGHWNDSYLTSVKRAFSYVAERMS